MARDLNKVHFIGNVGWVEEKNMKGRRLVTFSLATNLFWKDKSGQEQTRVEWHKCQCWIKDFPLPFVGDRMYIQGRLGYYEWTHPNDVEMKSAQVTVEEYIFLVQDELLHAKHPKSEVAPPPKKKKSPKKKKKDAAQRDIEF